MTMPMKSSCGEYECPCHDKLKNAEAILEAIEKRIEDDDDLTAEDVVAEIRDAIKELT